MSLREHSNVAPQDQFSKNFFKEDRATIQTSSGVFNQDHYWNELIRAYRKEGFEPSYTTTLPDDFNQLGPDQLDKMGAIMPFYQKYSKGTRCKGIRTSLQTNEDHWKEIKLQIEISNDREAVHAFNGLMQFSKAVQFRKETNQGNIDCTNIT